MKQPTVFFNVLDYESGCDCKYTYTRIFFSKVVPYLISRRFRVTVYFESPPYLSAGREDALADNEWFYRATVENELTMMNSAGEEGQSESLNEPRR